MLFVPPRMLWYCPPRPRQPLLVVFRVALTISTLCMQKQQRLLLFLPPTSILDLSDGPLNCCSIRRGMYVMLFSEAHFSGGQPGGLLFPPEGDDDDNMGGNLHNCQLSLGKHV